MSAFYSILLVIAVLIAIVFSVLVLATGKGDAMNGGGSVRTTFKGKASFDDIISKWTLYLGLSFMTLVLVIDVLGKRLDNASSLPVSSPASSAPVGTPVVPSPAPATTATAGAVAPPSTTATNTIPVPTPPLPETTSVPTATPNAPVGNAPVGNGPVSPN